MSNRTIESFDLISVPSLTDTFVCQQSSVTKKQTSAQILSNISNLSAASALDGTETTICRQGSSNVKMTLANLATYIISQA